MTSAGYKMKPSFRLKTSQSPFSDYKIQNRLRTQFFYLLAGFAISGAVVAIVLKTPEFKRTLYNYGPDNIMSASLIGAFPTCALLSAFGPEQWAAQHTAYAAWFICFGFFLTSHMLVPGVLIRRGLLPFLGMVGSITITLTSAPNPYFMQYFSLVSG
eukprot:UN28325